MFLNCILKKKLPLAGIVPATTGLKVQPDICCTTGAVETFIKFFLYVSNPTLNPKTNPNVTNPTPNSTPNIFPNPKPSNNSSKPKKHNFLLSLLKYACAEGARAHNSFKLRIQAIVQDDTKISYNYVVEINIYIYLNP